MKFLERHKGALAIGGAIALIFLISKMIGGTPSPEQAARYAEFPGIGAAAAVFVALLTIAVALLISMIWHALRRR